ncbi:MAG: phospholipase D family protein [Mycetocola sp.]
MLEPDARAALTEQLRPPHGYELANAVGTTFTLDLTSALAIPLSFAGHEVRESDDPIAILDAVRRAAERVDLFAQAGHIAVPRQASDLVAFLEPMTHTVVSRRTRALFHPKVWLLEFARGTERAYRLICSSRNLTSDRSWDMVVRLDGVSSGEPVPQNEPLHEFVRQLPELATVPLPSARQRRIADFAERLRNVEWELPPETRELHFHAFGIGLPVRIDFTGKRHLVISPFATDEGLERVTAGNKEPAYVVSRAESLDRLTPATLRRIQPYVLDDAARDSEEREDDPLVGLHAKTYVLDRKSGSRVFIGSANATEAAFGGNVEFVIELVGKQNAIGVDATFGETTGLRQLMIPYSTEGGVQETDTEKADRALENVVRALAAVRFRNTVTAAETDTYSIVTEALGPVPTFEGVEMQVQLLTRPGNAHVLPDAQGESVVFVGLDLTDITPFLVVRATDHRGEQRTSVVNAQLVGDISHRRDAVLARQIDSPEKFLRFLFLLLSLGGAGFAAALRESGGGVMGDWAAGGAGVFESLVRALGSNPTALEDLARLIDRFRLGDSEPVLPEGFEELWDAVWSAHRAENRSAS